MCSLSLLVELVRLTSHVRPDKVSSQRESLRHTRVELLQPPLALTGFIGQPVLSDGAAQLSVYAWLNSYKWSTSSKTVVSLGSISMLLQTGSLRANSVWKLIGTDVKVESQ